ncbi:MAG: hypothetical protein EAX96_01070 [Candidatus Lokiarchaeota archaeon]|nr:hypothetical protein [Candidatus Lokiarchaeota archaeon]
MHMIKVDILGYYDEKIITKLDNELPDIEFYEIEKLVEGEKFQDILIISIPTKKRKIRKKGFTKEEIKIIQNYLDNGGNVIILFPINEKYFDLMDNFFEPFEFSAVLNNEEKLLHINPNLIFYEKTKNGDFISGKRFVEKYIHFLFPHKVETLIEGDYSPVVALKRIKKGNLFLYGMGYNNFWKEDITKVFNYLLLKYEELMGEIQKDQSFILEIINQASKFKQNLITKIYSRNYKENHSINDILLIENEFLRQKIANGLIDQDFYEYFKDLSEAKIEQEYINFRKIFNEKNYKNALYQLTKVMVKFIIKGKISFERFKLLIEEGYLPEEALSLIIYFNKPLSPDDFRNYRTNINNLIKWNRKVKYLSEKKIKDKFFEISEIEADQTKKWEEIKKKEREKEFEIREERRRERDRRDQILKQMEEKEQEKEQIKEMIQQERLEKEKEKVEKLRQLRIQKYEQERQELLQKQKEREQRFLEIKQRKQEEKKKEQLKIREEREYETEKLEMLKKRREQREKEKLEADLLLKKELEVQDLYLKEVRERLQERLREIDKRKEERLEKQRKSWEKLQELKEKRLLEIETQSKTEITLPEVKEKKVLQQVVEQKIPAEPKLIPQIEEPIMSNEEVLEQIIFPLIDLALNPLYSLIEIIDLRQENRKELLFRSDEGENLLYILELFLTPKERILESFELKREMEDLF